MTWLFDNLQTVISVILVFGLLIFIHELGHFLLARRAGILVREFAIGFGPKIFTYKKNETRYTIRLFPLGGFVRMAGEDPEVIDIRSGQRLRILTNKNGAITHFLLDQQSMPHQGEEIVVDQIDILHELKLRAEDDEEEQHYAIHPQAVIVSQGVETQIAPWNRQYGSKTVGQRFWTIAAGPLANFILAFVLFIIIAAMNGVTSKEPVIGSVLEGYPAYEAGLQQGDRIITIDGTPIQRWEQMQNLINTSPNRSLQVTIQREEGQPHLQTTLTPRSSVYISKLSTSNRTEMMQGADVLKINDQMITSLDQANKLLADSSGKEISITVPTLKKGKEAEETFTVDLKATEIELNHVGKIGITPTIDRSIGTVLTEGPKETYKWATLIFQSVKQLFTTPDPLNQVGGPVAIFNLTGKFADSGLSALLNWAAILSINLGIFNLLPIPALDGGRLIFIVVEAIRGRPIDPAKESIVHFIGFALLMLLIIIVTWNDIQRLFL